MNKEQIIDEAYGNYRKTILTEFFENTKELRKWAAVEGPGGYNKEQFINKCKTDTEFSEEWGLKIGERELSLEERCDEYIKINPQETNDGVLNYKWIGDNLCTHEDYDKWNVPTKLITLTYNNETIEVYE